MIRSEKGSILEGLGRAVGIIITILIVVLIFIVLFSVRLDFASGQHRITPTSIDTDMWGNYKVYFKTSEYTQNSNEDYYYIDKDNTELKEQMEECIKNGDTVMVYYDKWVGFKGITAPDTSPITKIEILEED